MEKRSSCYNCKERHYLCHKDCLVYKNYTNRLETIKKNKKIQNESGSYRPSIKSK